MQKFLHTDFLKVGQWTPDQGFFLRNIFLYKTTLRMWLIFWMKVYWRGGLAEKRIQENEVPPKMPAFGVGDIWYLYDGILAIWFNNSWPIIWSILIQQIECSNSPPIIFCDFTEILFDLFQKKRKSMLEVFQEYNI